MLQVARKMAPPLSAACAKRSFQLVSDIHLEHLKPPIQYPLIQRHANNLILAGDIAPMTRRNLLEPFLTYVSQKWDNVIYVPGNHEYYDNKECVTWDTSYFPKNVHLLQNECIVIDGIKILGTTLWAQISDEDRFSIAFRLNDFKYIWKTPTRRLAVEEFNDMNDKAKAFLRKEAEDNCIIVTHHAPMPQCLADEHKGDVMSTCYVNDFDKDGLLENVKVAVWCYGHTHHAQDFMFKDTHIVSNPMGYPDEVGKTGYYESVCVEV